MRTYAYIDASNLFYGGKKSLGWSIDYQKLIDYLQDKYQVSKVYYFGGVEIHKFHFDFLHNETVPLKQLEHYLVKYIRIQGDNISEAELRLLDRHLHRVRFFVKLEKFGYQLILKPVKTYYDHDGLPLRKANCDVELTLGLIREKNAYERAIILSGDGDFLPVLKHLRQSNKQILVLARSSRTAKEIKKFAGSLFLDFEYLRERLKRSES